MYVCAEVAALGFGLAGPSRLLKFILPPFINAYNIEGRLNTWNTL